MRSVYSYIRFSTPEQAAGHSLQRQMDYARKYAEDNDLILDESLTLRDEGLSAYHQHHLKNGALGIFLKAVDEGKVLPGSVLILEGLDRLSRAKPIRSQALLSQIIEAGITVVTASDNKVYDSESLSENPMDLVYSLLVMIRAHEESATKAKRVKQAFRSQIHQWLHTGKGPIIRLGREHFWHRINSNGDRYELIPDKVEVVKLILSKFKKGYGLTRLCHYLNSNKVLGKDNWQQKPVKGIITSRALVGEKVVTLDDETFKIRNYYPPILSEDEYMSIIGIFKTRAPTKSQRKVVSLITGMQLSYCGYCNKSLNAKNYMYRGKKDEVLSKGFRRIFCSSYSNGMKCPVRSRSITVVDIEHALIRYCSDYMDFTAIMGEDDNRKEHQVKVSQARSELEEITEQINRMVNQFATMEKVPAIFVKKVNDLEEQQAKMAAKYESMKADLSLSVDDNDDVAERWKQLSGQAEDLDEEARLMIRQLIKRTFARIDIYLFGMDSDDADSSIDMILTFHNGVTRVLKIDKVTGSFTILNDYQAA